MNNISKYIITVALIASPATASAEAWSLDSCISYAISHNINVLQRELQIREGEQGIIEAKDRFLPTLDASASQQFNFGRGLTAQNTYADRNTSNFGWSAGLSLPLFQGMAEYRNLKLSKLSLQQYVFDNEAAKDNVALNVISQYLQVLYCKEVEQSARSQADLSAFEVERQKAMIEAGKAAEATIYDLEAVAAQDKLQIITSANDTQTALVNLANLLQLPSVEGFDVLPLGQLLPSIPGPEDVYNSAMLNNNSILSARQAIKVADQRISYAKSGYIPTLRFNAGLGSSYYRLGGFDNEAFSAQMRHNFQTYLGFSLSIPIFDGFNTRNSVRRAKLQQTSARLDLDQHSLDLYKDIQLAYYQATGARDRYLTSEETLEKTRLSFDSTRERFNLGRATQADYEQAKNNLFRTEVTRIQAYYEYLMRHRILMFYKEARRTVNND